MVLEKTLESPLDCKEIQPVHSEGDQSWVVVIVINGGFPSGTVVKNMAANAGDTGDTGSIPESGRSPGAGNGNPLQYSCLENSMDG